MPFTRWITPLNIARRFSTQMYVYMLPIASHDSVTGTKQNLVIPTPDGGVEHTSATFEYAGRWLARAKAAEVMLMPPQSYILAILARFMTGLTSPGGEARNAEAQVQRERFMEYSMKLPTAETKEGKEDPTAAIPWAQKVMSPRVLLVRGSDKRLVLGLDQPGRELEGTARGGDWERVVLVRITQSGPEKVEIRNREDVLAEEGRDGGTVKGLI